MKHMVTPDTNQAEYLRAGVRPLAMQNAIIGDHYRHAPGCSRHLVNRRPQLAVAIGKSSVVDARAPKPPMRFGPMHRLGRHRQSVRLKRRVPCFIARPR